MLLEGYDIASSVTRSLRCADAWRLGLSGFTLALTAGTVGLLVGSIGVGLLE